jgi:hypothetical protein
MIASMAASDWLLVATTVLGGVLTAGGGALVQWTGTRQSDARARNDYRRTAYVDLIAAVDELMRALKLPRPATTPKSRDSLYVALDRVDRAAAAVSLAGPPRAAELADKILKTAWKLPDDLFGVEGGDEKNVGNTVKHLLDRCKELVVVARAALGTDRD